MALLVARWQMDLFQLDSQRPGRDLANAIQRWRGCSDNTAFGRHTERIGRWQIPLLHERMAGRRERVESFGQWKPRSEGSRFGTQRRSMGTGKRGDFLL